MSSSGVARVLVVDDEPEIRQLLVDALAAQGVRAAAAADPEEAARLARQNPPDLLVADLCLARGDSGLEVIRRLRSQVGEIPALVITGHGSAEALAEASRVRPVEVMTKPLDLERFGRVVRGALSRQAADARHRHRIRRLRRLARTSNLDRKQMRRCLESAGSDLKSAYRALSDQMALSRATMEYQRHLLDARDDDDVFRNLFRTFAARSGPVFGIAMVCNADAELQIVGRFGVPLPDGLKFCQALCPPAVAAVLSEPRITLMDAGEQADLFPPFIRKYLVGLTILAVPLIPVEGEIIGLTILYRKGEQPFTDADIALAEAIAAPTAICIQRND